MLVFVAAISLHLLLSLESRTVQYTLVASKGNVAPDNYFQEAILINGRFPAPELRATEGDTLILHVYNHLKKKFTIHCHGLFQNGTQAADGVPDITQYAIPPNGYFKYLTRLTQSGTYFYHAHTGLDITWAVGALIIDRFDPFDRTDDIVFGYEHELVVLISQNWHTSIEEMEKGLTGKPFKELPETDSILINGRSYGVWNQTLDGWLGWTLPGYYVFRVKPNSVYRLRVIGASTFSMVTFCIEGHDMVIIEMDGVLTDPVPVKCLQLNAGQRYSVLVATDKEIGNYWISSEMIPGPGPRNGLAIFHYEKSFAYWSLRRQLKTGTTPKVKVNRWVEDQLHVSSYINQPNVYPVPQVVDQQIVLSPQAVEVNGYVVFLMNGVHVETPSVPLLYLHQEGRGAEVASFSGVYEIRMGQSIEVIFQNNFILTPEGTVCMQHPWHIHGHIFYVVGYGSGQFDPLRDNEMLAQNVATKRLQFRDVVTVHQPLDGVDGDPNAPCGWVAIRLVANNVGVWLGHCHFTSHLIIGKKFAFYEH